MRRLALGIMFCVAAVCVSAMAAQPPALPFQNGYRVCFVGDSITRGGIYHSYLQLFYATRYPARDISYFNCGHSGGAAEECLQRLSWDVLEHKPTVALVMFGMNDMAGVYGAPESSPGEVQKAVTARITSVEKSYTQLLDQLAAAGARLVLVGPSIYDDTARVDAKIERSNMAMTQWTTRVGQIAAQRHANFADLGAVMNPINQRQQAADPTATLVGNDRVHPGAVGQAVMAYTILKAQNVEPYVSRIVVDATSSRTEGSYECTVSNVQRSAGGLKFTCREKALPFVLPADASKALSLVPLTNEMNRELLTVSNLSPGKYELRIDNETVGEYSAAELAGGINLATNPKTPQYRQSAELAETNAQRNACESRYFRTKAYVRHCILNPGGVDYRDNAAVERFLKKGLADNTIGGFSRAMADSYLKDIAPHWTENVKRYGELVAKMKVQRQPKPHQFDLRPAGATQAKR